MSPTPHQVWGASVAPALAQPRQHRGRRVLVLGVLGSRWILPGGSVS